MTPRKITPARTRIAFCLMASPAMAAGTASTVDAHGMTRKQKNTLIGVGIGAIGGAVLSHGDIFSTIAGAAAGGVIGNVTTKNHHRHHDERRYHDHRHDNYDRHRH